MDAFRECSRERFFNQAGLQALQTSQIREVLEEQFGIERGERRARFIRMLKRMDEVVLEHSREKQKEAMKK